MIISHKHKYIFVELGRTGTSSISKELVKNYSGQYFLTKHATYRDFLKVAKKDEKEYFVFSAIRNPLDSVYSSFCKLESYWKGRDLSIGYSFVSKTITKWRLWKLKRHKTFSSYFRQSYFLPYDDWSSLDHENFDYIIRFENIQNDFETVLMTLGIEKVRPLPTINKTMNRDDGFVENYQLVKGRAKFIFFPYMKKWGYQFPSSWGEIKYKRFSILLWKCLKYPRAIYWNNKNLLFKKSYFKQFSRKIN